VLADLLPRGFVADLALVTGFTLMIAASAQVVIPLPFTPVPITGQTLAVLLGAAALGKGRALAGVGAYLGLGAAGVGWFAPTGGSTYGYLAGFALAAWLVGHLASVGGDRRPLRAAGTMALGNLVIYVAGVAWLAPFLDVGLGEAVSLGVVPFLWGDALKIVMAAALLPSAWRLAGRGGHA
jgi:biotin transport system substrate-specific component